MQEKRQIKYRIGIVAIVVLCITAIIFDLLTLIPFVGTFIGWIFWIGAFIYLWMTGHGVANWKVLSPQIVSVVAEFIPAVQELPTIIAAVLAIIIISRAEDKTGLSLMPKMSTKGVRAPRKVEPLNQGGIRAPREQRRVEQTEAISRGPDNIEEVDFRNQDKDEKGERLDMAA